MPFKYHYFSPWDDNELCYARPGSPPAFFSLPSPVSPRVCSNCIPGITAGSSATTVGGARKSFTQFLPAREPARVTISSSSSSSSRTPQLAAQSPPRVLPPPSPSPSPLLKWIRNALKGPGLPQSKPKPLLWGTAEGAPDESMEWEKLITSSSFDSDEDLMEALFGYDPRNLRKIEEGEGSSTSAAKLVHNPKSLQNITSLRAPGRHPSPSRFPQLSSEPLHEDKVCDATDLPMVWGELTSSSFVVDEELMQALFSCGSMENEDTKSQLSSPAKHVLDQNTVLSNSSSSSPSTQTPNEASRSPLGIPPPPPPPPPPQPLQKGIRNALNGRRSFSSIPISRAAAT